MSWTDLFKSKSSAPEPDPRIRWFGKLPTYPDYYRSPSDEQWAVEFNTWVLKGYQVYSSRISAEETRKSKLPLTACIIRLPESGMTVFSSILDYGGDMRGRPFPMCFYAAVPTHLWQGPTSGSVMAGADVLRRLLGLRQEVARFVNAPGAFEAVFDGREVELGGIEEGLTDHSWVGAGRTISMDQWFEGARSGLKCKHHGDWMKLTAAFGSTIAQHDGKGFEPTLRFPLAVGIRLDVQVAGWLKWLETRMDLGKRIVSLLVSGNVETEVGSLTVIARDIMPDDFLLLTGLAKTLPYLDDLSAAAPAKSESDTNESPDAGPASEVANGQSWIDFVEGVVAPT